MTRGSAGVIPPHLLQRRVMEPGSSPASWATVRRLGSVVARHPDIWLEAVRLAVATAPASWWRRRPFLPVPDASYLRWRAATAYGGGGEVPEEPEDVVAYLRWRRRQR